MTGAGGCVLCRCYALGSEDGRGHALISAGSL